MNNRIVFNDDFYKVSALLLSKKFLALEVALQSKYLSAGLAVPEKGFSNETIYREWLSKALKVSESPGKEIEDILVKFNLDPKNEYYRNCLTARLFLHKMPWEQSQYTPVPIELITEIKKPSKGIWVKIYPWTKKEDYKKLWPSINNLQRISTEYRGKEKFQTSFERDFAVYQLYLEAKKKIELNKSGKRLSIMDTMFSLPDYEIVVSKFGNDFSDNIRAITSDLRKRLAGVDIL